MIRTSKEFWIVLFACGSLFLASYFQVAPIKALMDTKAIRNTRAGQSVNLAGYQIYDFSNGRSPLITIDFQKGKHFWNPQLAIWLEDSAGHYFETLLVTTSTAKGLFYAGRTAENFKTSDETRSDGETIRVDALPYWSHKRDHVYPDGYYSPLPDNPLPDGITAATPKGNFQFLSSVAVTKLSSFRVVIEVNVAFDENEYYSEYDFTDDSLYHGGTGLLGQPSLIYSTLVKKSDKDHYYVMSLQGRGHHSGRSGELFPDLSTITTARYVVERIIVGVDEKWFLPN